MNNMFKENSILIGENGKKHLLKNRIEESNLFINSFLKKRELIFFLCNNTIDSISLYVSFINKGVVPILINSVSNNGRKNLGNCITSKIIFSIIKTLYHNYN